jgi:hypothetical protein
VPEQLDGLAQNLAQGVEGVVVAVRAGKDDDTEFHLVVTPARIRGICILAQRRAARFTPHRPADSEIHGKGAAVAGIVFDHHLVALGTLAAWDLPEA